MKIKKKPVVKKPKTKRKPTKMKKMFKKMDGKSKLEVTFQVILDDLGLNYEYQYKFQRRTFDFFLPDFNLLIEVDGDFFHCNPELGIEAKFPFQKKTLKNDRFKNEMVENDPEMRLLRFWENDINKRRSEVIERLLTSLVVE